AIRLKQRDSAAITRSICSPGRMHLAAKSCDCRSISRTWRARQRSFRPEMLLFSLLNRLPIRPTSLLSYAYRTRFGASRWIAASNDGTKVPLNIIRRKGTSLDGNNPTLLYGYGGYGLSMQPNFDFPRRVWFNRGGVFVVANIRGGGEFGEDWHKAGNLTKKQN